MSLFWRMRERELDLSVPCVMGILNVTPDSFSDGGRFASREAAVAHALAMAEAGAAILDIGGESTRPGAAGVDLEEELRRVVPVIEAIRQVSELPISIDTMKAPVARAALEAGADIINDVSALTADPEMPGVAREYGAGVVLMHMRGTPRTMQAEPRYDDVVSEIAAYLTGRAATLEAAGLASASIVLDPGIGFGKSVAHNLSLLAATEQFAGLGYPVLIGLSRKRFLEQLTGAPVDQRLAGSLAGLVFAALHGAKVLRVHDVRESCDALRVALELQRRQRQEFSGRATQSTGRNQ